MLNGRTIKELKREARDYIASIRGENLTVKDIENAEKLIIMGYLKGIQIKREKLIDKE